MPGWSNGRLRRRRSPTPTRIAGRDVPPLPRAFDRFGLITEFSSPLKKTPSVAAAALEPSGIEREAVLACGPIDLLGLQFAIRPIHLSDTDGGPSGASHRRSTGVVRPTAAGLAKFAGAGHTLDDRVGPERWKTGFLTSLVYARLSPVYRLCAAGPALATRGGSTLAALGRLVSAGSPFITILDAVLEANHTPQPVAKVGLSPLVGIDGIYLVMLVGSDRLEVVAAVARALRAQCISHVLDGDALAHSVAVGEAFLCPPVAKPDSVAKAALFDSVVSVVGRRVLRADNDRIELVADTDETALLAAEAILRRSMRFPPGYQKGAVAWGQEQESDAGEGFLTLLGHRQLELCAKEGFQPGPTLRRDFTRMLTPLLDASPAPPRAAAPLRTFRITDVAVQLVLPPEQLAFPTCDADQALRRLLGVHKGDELERTRGWTRRWEAACDGFGFVLRDAGVRLIAAAREAANNDPEQVADVLEHVDALVGSAERVVAHKQRHQPAPRVIGRLLRDVERELHLLGRRSAPLLPPLFPAEWQPNAGIGRDAYMGYLKAQLRSLGLKKSDPILVDSLVGDASVQSYPGTPSTYLVSVLSLVWPASWIAAAHEAIHVQFARVPVIEITSERVRAAVSELLIEVEKVAPLPGDAPTISVVAKAAAAVAVRLAGRDRLQGQVARWLDTQLEDVFVDAASILAVIGAPGAQAQADWWRLFGPESSCGTPTGPPTGMPSMPRSSASSCSTSPSRHPKAGGSASNASAIPTTVRSIPHGRCSRTCLEHPIIGSPRSPAPYVERWSPGMTWRD